MDPAAIALVACAAALGVNVYFQQRAKHCPANPLRPNAWRITRFFSNEHCDHQRRFKWIIKHGTRLAHSDWPGDEDMTRAISVCCFCKRTRNHFYDMEGVDLTTLNWIDK